MTVRSDPLSATVRLARVEDALAIARLAGQLNYPATAEDVARRLRCLEGDAQHVVYLAELADRRAAGSVLGWMHVQEHRLVQSDTQADSTRRAPPGSPQPGGQLLPPLLTQAQQLRQGDTM